MAVIWRASIANYRRAATNIYTDSVSSSALYYAAAAAAAARPVKVAISSYSYSDSS